MAKQALIDAINESIAPFVHPDDLKPSRLTLSLWSGRIRFPHGLRLNADAINKELAKSNPSASRNEGHSGTTSSGIGDRIRRRGRGNSMAEGSSHPPKYSHHASSSVAAGDGPTSGAEPDGATPKAATSSSGGAGGGMWSPFSFGTGWSRSEAATEQQSNSTRERSPGVSGQQAKATRRMSNGTAGASTLASDLVGGDGALNMGGNKVKSMHDRGVSYTTPSSYLDEAWAVNVHLEKYRSAKTEEDHQQAREEAHASDTSSRSTNPFLAGLGLPSNVRLISGYVRQVQVDIPWSSLATKPVVIKLSGVKLAVMPTTPALEQNDVGGIAAAATSHATATGGGGLFRARGKEAMMRKLRTREEQAVSATRRRILMEKEIRKRQQDAFLRCLFEDRAAGSGREDVDRETSGRDSPAPSIASVGSRSTVTGSGSDLLRAAAHTSVASTVLGTSSEQRRMSFVLGNDDEEDEDGYGMHSISTSSATSMYHRSSLNTSASRSQSPFLKSPASESMRKMARRKKMPTDVFRSRLRRKIMENLCLDVRGIHIQICKLNETDEEAPARAKGESSGFVLGVVLDSLQLYTTDEHGRKARTQGRGNTVKRSTFLKPKSAGKGVDSTGGRPLGSTFLFKALRVNGLGVYLEEGKSRVEIDEETLFGGATLSSRDNGPDQGDMYGASSLDSAHRRPSDSGDDLSLASMETDGLREEVLAGGYGRRYVVNPISFEAAYRQRNDELSTVLQSQSASAMAPVQRRQTEKGAGGDDETEYLLFSQLPHLSVVLSEPQLRLASKVVDSFLPIGENPGPVSSVVIRPLYPEYRPACSITSLTASDWWRYAIRSVRRRKRPGSYMWRSFMFAFRKKREYLSLYKRHVAHCDPRDQAFYEMVSASNHRCTKYCCRAYERLAPTDVEVMRAIEDDRSVSVEALLGWRAEAEAQLWREQRLQTKVEDKAQLELGESISRLQSVFQGGLGSFGGNASPSTSGEVEIQVDDMDTNGNQNAASLALTAEDLNQLELQLEAYNDSLSRTSSSRIAEFELSLGFVVVDLVSSDFSPVAKLRVGTLDLSYALFSNSQSALSLTLSSVLLEDMTTFDPMIHTVMRSVHHAAPMDDNRSCASGHSGVGTSGGSTTQPCPASKFTLKCAADGDVEVNLKMTTFEFLLSPSFSSSLSRFLDLAGNDYHYPDAPGLYRYANKIFGASMQQIKSRAKSSWDEKCQNGKRWDLDIAVDPVVVIVPGNAVDADSRAVILSLGQHQLRTTPRDEEKQMDSFAQVWFDGQIRSSERSLGSTASESTTPKENEGSSVTDRWELHVSGITAAIGPSNDENWRHYVVDELIHAGAHSDGNMIAADVRPYLILRPCAFNVDLGSSTVLEEGIIKHRRSWLSANVASPPLLIRLRSDDIIALGRSTRQMQDFFEKLSIRLPSDSSTDSVPISGLGESVASNLCLREYDNDPINSGGIFPASIAPNDEQPEQPCRKEEPTHVFHFSYGIPRLKVALKLSREGSFVTQFDSVYFGLSSNSDKTTKGQFELANAWVFYQVEEAEPTLIFGDTPPSSKPAASNGPDHEDNLVSAELLIAGPVAESKTYLKTPFEAMDLTLCVKTRDVAISMHPKLLRLAIKSYRRIKQGLLFASVSTADEHTLHHLSTGQPGTSTVISFPLGSNLVDDGSVGTNSSSDSSVSTAESLMKSYPGWNFLGHFFPALSNVRRDLFRPASTLAVTASFTITSISISIIPDHSEEPSRFDVVFSDNVFCIDTDDDGGRTTSIEMGKVAVTSASSYAYRQEYCNMMKGGDGKETKFLELNHTRSPSSTIDTETGKIQPQTQTHVRIAPIHCVYLQSQVTILSDFLHKSGLRALLSPTLSMSKCLAFIDTNELADIKLQDVIIKIPESWTSTTKFSFRVGSTSIVHTIDPSDFAIKAVDLDDISLCCANNKAIGNPISISAEITAARLAQEFAGEADSKQTVQRIQISSSEIHLDITPSQYRQSIATLVNNIGSTKTNAIDDLTGSSPRPRALRGNKSSSKNSSLRSLQSSVGDTGTGSTAGEAAAVAAKNGSSALVPAKIELSIIIPAISLSLCDERNAPFAKVSAERAATLIEYGTETSPDIRSSIAFGLYSLEITDERSCVDQNEGGYLLRQLFGEGGIKEALGISSKENDDGSFRMRANVGAWQMNLIPDLLDEVQDFFRLPADHQGELAGGFSLIGIFGNMISDVKELEAPPPSTFELKTSVLKLACFEEPVPDDIGKSRPRRCITLQFALESKGSVQVSNDSVHFFESQTNVDAIEMYSAEGKALEGAVQVISPTSISLFASKSATEEGDGTVSTLTAKFVVSEPIDLTVSTQDILLIRNVCLGLHEFSQAAIESLSDSISFLNASATLFGKFDAIGDIPQSTSDVPRMIDISSSASQFIDVSVMIPSSSLVLVNDNAALLPIPLFKFTTENILLESQADIVNEEVPSSLGSTILPTHIQLRMSIRGELFDSVACRWKMSSQCDAEVSYYRQQETSLGEGECSKRLDVELNPFEIVSSRELFEKLALASPFIWMVDSELEHSDVLEGTRVVPDGPYAIRNYTGFHFHFSLHEQEESYECKAGETKHFVFENSRGFGFGYSRVFGQDFEDGKSISVFEKQDANSTKADPHLLSLSFEDIDAELGSCRAHKYGDGRIVFSEVVSENARMVLVIRARVLFHNFTRYNLDVGMKLGNFYQACCSCSGLNSQKKLSPEAIAQVTQTVALGIPQSDRAVFDEAAEKAKSRLALQLRLNGSTSDPIIVDGSSLVGTIELPSVPALTEMTTKGSISETKTMSFTDASAEEENHECNGLCAHITFVSTIMDGHPSVEIYFHPKAILRSTYPTRLYFAMSTSRGERSIDTLQLEAGESVQLFTSSNKAHLRVQAEPLDGTSTVVGAVEVRTAWSNDSERASTEKKDPDSNGRLFPRLLGTLMIHSDSGVVEGLLNESTWAAAQESGPYVPPTRLISLDPRHILFDFSNSFSVECSDHPGSLELPSFLLDGILTTPLPQTEKNPRILLREGTSGRTVLLQARSVPYGKSSVEASPLPLAGNSGQFSGYYALKKDYGAVAGALQFHIINGFNIVNDTPNDVSVAELSADGHKFTLHPNSSANVSWHTAKDDGISLSVHHNGSNCFIEIGVNSVGEKKYELRGDTFFGRVSVCVMAGGKDARLRVRIHSLNVDDAKGVTPMPANGMKSTASVRGGIFSRVVWGSGITISRLRVPHLRILQYTDDSQQLALFVIDNLDAEYCIDDSSLQRPGHIGLVEHSCAIVAAKALTIDDLRNGHSVSVMCNAVGESTDDLFRVRIDVQRPVQSEILELEVKASFPTLSKRHPLDITTSADFVDAVSKEWVHCTEKLYTNANVNRDSAHSRLRWKKFVAEPLHLSLAIKPGEDKRTEVGSSPLVYYIPLAVLNMLGNGQDIAARVSLAEIGLGDTSTSIDTLARVLQVFYASELKSCVSAEFSEATQSDLLADLRQRRAICQIYTPYSNGLKPGKKVLFSDDSNAFEQKLKSLGCKAAPGADTAKSDESRPSSMKKTKRKSSTMSSEGKKSVPGTEKAKGWFGR